MAQKNNGVVPHVYAGKKITVVGAGDWLEMYVVQLYSWGKPLYMIMVRSRIGEEPDMRYVPISENYVPRLETMCGVAGDIANVVVNISDSDDVRVVKGFTVYEFWLGDITLIYFMHANATERAIFAISGGKVRYLGRSVHDIMYNIENYDFSQEEKAAILQLVKTL